MEYWNSLLNNTTILIIISCFILIILTLIITCLIFIIIKLNSDVKYYQLLELKEKDNRIIPYRIKHLDTEYSYLKQDDTYYYFIHNDKIIKISILTYINYYNNSFYTYNTNYILMKEDNND